MYERMVAVTNHRLCRVPEGADQTEDGCFEPGTGLWESYLDQIRKIVSVKPRAVVLREKDLSPEIYRKLAEEVDQICREQDRMLILNTAPAAAAQLGMRKLHLPMSILRREGRPLDAECVLRRRSYRHFSDEPVPRKVIKEALELGADYLFAGNIYETDCKKGLPGRGLDFLSQVCMESSVPVYAIGGVNEERLPEILSTGAAGGCMMSGFMKL